MNKAAQGRMTIFGLLAVLLMLAPALALTPEQEAGQILDAAGVTGGLVAHLGCGDGRLTAALYANDGFVVHGLDPNSDNVAAARAYIRSEGLYGDVSVNTFSGSELPYIDNLVNLVVSRDLGSVPMAEVMRVLSPYGTAYIHDGETWTKTVKDWPAEMDEWSHYLRSANNNAVSRDTAVGPPRHVQWIFEPKWTRSHHKLNSVSSVVTAKGRMFHIFDKGPVPALDLGADWHLVAQDAFNGTILWEKKIDTWADTSKKFRSGPVQLQRVLVTDGDYVYLPMGLSTGLTAIDAVTGEEFRTYENTDAVEEIVYDDGMLYVLTGDPSSEQDLTVFPNAKSICAIDPNSGILKWKYDATGDITPVTLAVDGPRVFFHADGNVVCLNKASGVENWSEVTNADGSRAVGWATATLVVSGDVVLLAASGQLWALSATDGTVSWNVVCGSGFKSAVDVFVIDGAVWPGYEFEISYDLLTGAVLGTNTIMHDLQTAGHHHRCYREKATVNYIIGGHRGLEFMDLHGDDHSRHNWTRGTCQYGILPANGLNYMPPHSCGCYMETKIFGFSALAGARTPWNLTTPEPQFQPGGAYGTVVIDDPYSDQWPSYRGDAKRSATAANGPDSAFVLETKWQTSTGAKLSAPTVADNKLLVADIDGHRVLALDASNGSEVWSYTAGGRIDSPPSAYNGMAFFGSNDGFVYCLALEDGALIWRFRAAPVNMFAMVQENVESVWPVPGSILIQDDTVYFAAGRSTYLDDGVFFYGLDPRTGAVKYSTQYKSIHGGVDTSVDDGLGEISINQNAEDYKTRNHPDLSDAFSMAGAIADVLSGDGSSVFMKSLQFDNTLAEEAVKKVRYFSTSGILDGEENHRSHAIYGTGDFSRTAVAYSWTVYKNNKEKWLTVPFGMKLAFDDNTIWGAVRGTLYNQTNTGVLNNKYVLYSKDLGSYAAPDWKTKPEGATYSFNWQKDLDMRPRALIGAGDNIFVGGMPDRVDPNYPFAVIEGQREGVLKVYDADSGDFVSDTALESPPVWDGIAAANGRLYLCLEDGGVMCIAGASGLNTDPPDPNPAEWSQVPAATGIAQIAMTAETGIDPNGPVRYRFECLTAGGHSSNWQISPTYTDTGLLPGNTYTYRVQMRDVLGNTGGFSSAESATTESAPAISTIFFNASPPTQDVLVFNSDIGTSQFRISDTIESGQTFTYSRPFLLEAVTFHLKKDGQANPYPAGAEATFSVYTGWGGSSATDGTLLGSTTFSMEGLSFLGGDYATFNLSEGASAAIGTLQAGTEYAIVIGTNQSDEDSRIYITRDVDVNPYAGGTGVFGGNIQTNRDTTFYIQGQIHPDIGGGSGIDYEDFAVISLHFMEICFAPEWCDGADLNVSGSVDPNDVRILGESWFGLP